MFFTDFLRFFLFFSINYCVFHGFFGPPRGISTHAFIPAGIHVLQPVGMQVRQSNIRVFFSGVTALQITRHPGVANYTGFMLDILGLHLHAGIHYTSTRGFKYSLYDILGLHLHAGIHYTSTRGFKYSLYDILGLHLHAGIHYTSTRGFKYSLYDILGLHLHAGIQYTSTRGFKYSLYDILGLHLHAGIHYTSTRGFKYSL